MFDIGSYSPWLIVALVGLIIFRPDDWQELAFHGGRWAQRARAYVYEWQEYLEFSPGFEKNKLVEMAAELNQSDICEVNRALWPSNGIGSRVISVQPHI